MSEPVSNAEIEDVLSSIRRLVSSDVAESQDAVADEPAAKLILTADFRVPEPDDTPSEEDAAQDTQEAEVSEAEASDAGDDTPFEFHHTERSTDEDTQTAQAEPDQEDTFEGTNADSNEVWQDLAEQAEDAALDEDGATPSLESTIADLEAAIGQQNGEWEPDGSDFEEDADAEEVMSEPVQDWIDGTAQEVGAEAAALEDEAEDTDLFGGEESVIDEETLRDMVSDIVRQELQGALGERITRNVRKLVRREINRVLAAQDFE